MVALSPHTHTHTQTHTHSHTHIHTHTYTHSATMSIVTHSAMIMHIVHDPQVSYILNSVRFMQKHNIFFFSNVIFYPCIGNPVSKVSWTIHNFVNVLHDMMQSQVFFESPEKSSSMISLVCQTWLCSNCPLQYSYLLF